MKISAKAEYACLALLALAQQGPDAPPLRIREISRIARRFPERYLVQILLQLKGAGLVASTRGAAGGYRLARPAVGDLARRSSRRDRRSRTRSAKKPKGNRAAAATLASVWEDVREPPNARVLDRPPSPSLSSKPLPHEWIDLMNRRTSRLLTDPMDFIERSLTISTATSPWRTEHPVRRQAG